MGASEATVFVVDDDGDVREGLSRLLRSAGWKVMEFGSAAAFLGADRGDGPGCLLLDVGMPEMTGPELHERLRELDAELPVIYLTGNGDVSTSVNAMKRGALDFLEKPVDGDLLLQVIGHAIERSRQICSRRGQLSVLGQRLAHLSAREREVMDQVIRGRLNKQIAGDLGIAEKTVKVHRGRVMEKMRVRSVAELVRLCEELAGDEAAP